ncbi:MAG: sodium:solute symporter [Bacteroidota bacterium]|nr:sodium:solute symporter [Candidatus Kapabacteria bacterium]MDW8218917.1 sodium:solute symporter [Bacteroidota bacterium]
MHIVDWLILSGILGFVVVWSIYKSSRRSRSSTMHDFVLSGKEARWYTVAISIMATQASAITFISLPGQAYVDGMRFIQAYFGLPLAMVLLCIIALPLYHRLDVLTAYEFLERRFDTKTRTLAALLFLLQRSLAAAISLYAPSIVLSLLLGWDVRSVITLIGVLVILYTTSGGTRAVSWAQSSQMAIIAFGMISVGIVVVYSLPSDVSLRDALCVAAVSGKLNTIDFTFDLNNKYTVWSGLLGGLFLQLSYFGTDQSQVQRYLSGESLTQSRLGLLFNGIMKIPMQFGILLIGALLFVFYQFTPPPIFFNHAEIAKLQHTHYKAEYQHIAAKFQQVSIEQQNTLRRYLHALHTGNITEQAMLTQVLHTHAEHLHSLKVQVRSLLKRNDPRAVTNDTNYIFLTFVITYLPIGLVGLLIAVVFSASMSSASSEINALASTTVIDIYRRLLHGSLSEERSVWVTRLATIMWGAIVVGFAQLMDSLGSLIEAVNVVGSLFYGAILGIFFTAFFLKRASGTAVFCATLLTEAIVLALYAFSPITFLWYNLIGCLLVVLCTWLLSRLFHIFEIA